MGAATRFLALTATAALSLASLAGCTTSTSNGGSVGSPSCLPYHSPLAVGPGPSPWGLRMVALQPIFAGAHVTLDGVSPPAQNANMHGGWNTAKYVRFYVVADLADVMPYGQSPNTQSCISRHGFFWGQETVRDGNFTWAGTVPSRVTSGHSWYVVAVGDNGFYATLNLADGDPNDLSMYRLSKPYSLVVWPGTEAKPSGTPDSLEIGKLFHLIGRGLSPTGPLLVRLEVQAPGGFDSDADLGVVHVRAGRLDGTLTLPRSLKVLGVGRRTLSPAWSYQLSLWSTNGKLIYYSLPVVLH